ncbi:hypothetical protein NTC87_23325, partial [Stenotrophomonas geniculata]|nr:hypothetical protein [Stenotrophomonas geniculata]
MSDEHADIEGECLILPSYSSALADTLFPGDDFWCRQQRDDFSEMLVLHRGSGGVLNEQEIRVSLAQFIPARVMKTQHPAWKARLLEAWEDLERPRLLSVLDAYFLGRPDHM